MLGSLGQVTVREVHNGLQARREIGYTTVLKLKLMKIMAAKGLIERDGSVRPQHCWPLRTRKQTQRQATRELVERPFEGSSGKLVLPALSGQRASGAELEEIRELLDRIEAGCKETDG